MATVLITTDFSKSAENALRYACCFFHANSDIELVLLNIYAIPNSYSGEGVSMAAIGDSLGETELELRQEYQWIREEYPNCKIKYREIIGDFVKSLEQEIEAHKAVMVVMGTPEAYGEMRLWGPDILNALTKLPIPVLTVPKEVMYKPIENIAFACILDNISSNTPFESIRKLVKYTKANLHVVSVMEPENIKTTNREAELLLHRELQTLNPSYHTLHDNEVVSAIGKFVAHNHIDLLLVRPRKHGVWYNLFHKSYSKELAKLNLIPVIALHEKWDIHQPTDKA